MSWVCPACGEINDASSSWTCADCGKEKPGVQAIDGAAGSTNPASAQPAQAKDCLRCGGDMVEATSIRFQEGEETRGQMVIVLPAGMGTASQEERLVQVRAQVCSSCNKVELYGGDLV